MKKLSYAYFMTRFVYTVKWHMGNVFNKPPCQNAPTDRVLTSVILKGIEWAFRKEYPTKIPGMVHQGLLAPQSLGTNLLILIILAGDIEMNPGPRSQCRLCKKYCKASEKSVKCEECEKRFHTSCISLDEKKLLELESGNGSWYCTNCKADCGLCSGAVLYGHKAVQCDKFEMWIHNKCSLITESEFDSVGNTNCTWICPNVTFFNFSDSFFADQLNLENENRFDQLANFSGTKASQTGSDKNKFITGLKFVSININSIRGKTLELLAFLDFINLRLWQFRRQKLTAPYQPQNCFRNLVHIMCTEKIEP